MNARFGCMLIALALAAPLSADLGGITTTPINIPAQPFGIVVGSDGNLWVLTSKGNLGKLTPDGTYKEFPLQFGLNNGGSSNANYISSGSDGNLWITGQNGHIERITTNGAVTDFAVAPSLYFPFNPVAGADGAIWFFDRQFPGPNVSSAWKLGRIDIYGQVTTYDLGISGDSLAGLVSGGDGNLWFIDETKSQVVKFSMVTKSVAGTFAIPSASNQKQDDQMILGWDGNVWFTRGTSIDRVTLDGAITEFHTPSGGQPSAILMSGDNNIWFTEPSSGKLGQLVMSSITPGGSATINESSTIFSADVHVLLIVPPAFAGLSAAAHALDIAPNDKCPPTVHIGFDTFGRPFITFTPPAPDCVPVSLAEVHPVFSGNNNVTALDVAANFLGSPVNQRRVGSVEPFALHPFAQTPTLTVVLNLAVAPGVAITNVSASDPSATVSFSALKATITSSTSVTAIVSLSSPSAAQPGSVAGAVVLSSNLPDPDPRQHIASFFGDPSSLGGRRGAIPPNLSDVVVTPVKRGH